MRDETVRSSQKRGSEVGSLAQNPIVGFTMKSPPHSLRGPGMKVLRIIYLAISFRTHASLHSSLRSDHWETKRRDGGRDGETVGLGIPSTLGLVEHFLHFYSGPIDRALTSVALNVLLL